MIGKPISVEKTPRSGGRQAGLVAHAAPISDDPGRFVIRVASGVFSVRPIEGSPAHGRTPFVCRMSCDARGREYRAARRSADGCQARRGGKAGRGTGCRGGQVVRGGNEGLRKRQSGRGDCRIVVGDHVGRARQSGPGEGAVLSRRCPAAREEARRSPLRSQCGGVAARRFVGDRQGCGGRSPAGTAARSGGTQRGVPGAGLSAYRRGGSGTTCSGCRRAGRLNGRSSSAACKFIAPYSE